MLLLKKRKKRNMVALLLHVNNNVNGLFSLFKLFNHLGKNQFEQLDFFFVI